MSGDLNFVFQTDDGEFIAIPYAVFQQSRLITIPDTKITVEAGEILTI